MRILFGSPLCALLIASIGCSAERVEGAPERSAELRVAAAKVEPDRPATEEKTAASDGITWGNRIAWRSWESALSAAKQERKSICVVVYADWCARCKELAPAFSLPEVSNAAEDLLMVRQDQDERPAWLNDHLGSYGSYVPRVLFLDPDGKVREDIQSGHPRYPYFYSALITDQLIASMRAASGG